MNKFSQQYNLKNRDFERLFETGNKHNERKIRPKSAQTTGCTQSGRRRRIHSATVRKVASYIIDSNSDPSMQVAIYQEDPIENRLAQALKPKNLSLTVDNSHLVKTDNRSLYRCSKSRPSSGNKLISSASSECISSSPSIPSTLMNLKEYITKELPSPVYHPALEGTLVLLPGLGCIYGKDNELPVLPAVHHKDEDYPYTHVIPNEHVHKPKKYSHPYYERMKKIKGWVCNHSGREVRVGSVSGETIHRFTLNLYRTKDEIREEIVELERLMKGLSTDWGKASVVLYQNEINNLQQMVKDTLSMTNLPETPPETPDPTGLRKFCKEYDTALQALQDRHNQCMYELSKLEEMEQLYRRAELLAISTP